MSSDNPDMTPHELGLGVDATGDAISEEIIQSQSPVSPMSPMEVWISRTQFVADGPGALRAHILQNFDVPELVELMRARKTGKESTALDAYFERQRNNADNATLNTRTYFTWKMSSVMSEMDRRLHFLPSLDESAFNFLDVGCASGGFTRYLLQRYATARGTGISLPVEEGGHPMEIEEKLYERFEMIWQNLLSFDLGPPGSRPPKAHDPIPVEGSRYDLVVLDGHHLRTQVRGTYTRATDWTRLLLAQLQIGLRCAKHGGTIVLKLSRPEFDLSGRILFILHSVCRTFDLHKPSAIHKSRGTFYVVAREVQRSELLSRYVRHLQDCWWDLTYGGEAGDGMNGQGEEVLTQAITFEMLFEEPFISRLVRQSIPVWRRQSQALQKLQAMY